MGAAKAQAHWQKQEEAKAIVEDILEVEVSNFNFGCVTNMILTGANSGMNITTAPVLLKEEGRHHRHHDSTPVIVSSDTGDAAAMAKVDTDENANETIIEISDFDSFKL